MTIVIYKINRETGARTDVQSKRTFLAQSTPDETLGYPRCTCPTCTASGTVIRPGRIAAALMSAESARQTAYRAWLVHTQECAGCTAADRANTGCATGQGLWRTYRDSPR
jgi:hypothetical protein